MKSSIIAMSVAALLAFGAASAATPATAPAPAKAPTAQQSKMGACASANKGKKGDDYKKSVSSCMKAPAAAAAPAAAPAAAATLAAAPAKTLTPQQQKMSDCSKANKGKKGDEYKAAQKACLSKK